MKFECAAIHRKTLADLAEEAKRLQKEGYRRARDPEKTAIGWRMLMILEPAGA